MLSLSIETSTSPVAIVTAGAGLGIGHGLTETLCAAGWSVVIADRDGVRAEGLAKRIREKDGIIESVVLDVTAPGAAERVVEVALQRFGRLDGLVNNAGVGLTKMVHETTDEEFLELFNVDFMASFRFARAALPSLRQSAGSLVNIGSVHARLNAPKYALYAATKSALEAFTRGLAVDYGADGVRANIVHPGLVESPQNEALLANLFADPRAWMNDFARKRQCIPRLALPQEVGALVTFLLGEKSRLITGQSIFIDGGTTSLLWDNE